MKNLFAQLFIILNIAFFLFGASANQPLFAMFNSSDFLWAGMLLGYSMKGGIEAGQAQGGFARR